MLRFAIDVDLDTFDPFGSLCRHIDQHRALDRLPLPGLADIARGSALDDLWRRRSGPHLLDARPVALFLTFGRNRILERTSAGGMVPTPSLTLAIGGTAGITPGPIGILLHIFFVFGSGPVSIKTPGHEGVLPGDRPRAEPGQGAQGFEPAGRQAARAPRCGDRMHPPPDTP